MNEERQRPEAGTPEEQQQAAYAAYKIAFYNSGNRGVALRPTSEEEELLQRAYGTAPGQREFYRLEQSNRIAFACAILADAACRVGFFAPAPVAPPAAPEATSGFVMTEEQRAALEQPAAVTLALPGGSDVILPKEEKEKKGGRTSKEKAADEPTA